MYRHFPGLATIVYLITQGNLYIEQQNLKERYKDENNGIRRINAYVRSLEKTRNITITVGLKEHGIVELAIGQSESRKSVEEVKKYIQGELCSVSESKLVENGNLETILFTEGPLLVEIMCVGCCGVFNLSPTTCRLQQ